MLPVSAPSTTLRRRANAFLLAGLVVLLILVLLALVGGVESVEFLSGRGFTSSSAPSPVPMLRASNAWRVIAVIMRVVTIVAGSLFVLQAVFDRSRRRIYLCIVAVCCVLLFAASVFNLDELPAEVPETPTLEGRWQRAVFETGDSQADDVPVEANVLQYALLAVALSCLLVAGAWLLLRRCRRDDPFVTFPVRDDILRSLQDAHRRLRVGEDARSVVLYCYQEMLDTLGTKGHIDATPLTPREFESRLRWIGLSDTAVARLTNLFEGVRYADRSSDDVADVALACLDSIRMAHSR